MLEITQSQLDDGRIKLIVKAESSQIDDAFTNGIPAVLSRMNIPMSDDADPIEFVKELAGDENVDDFLRSTVLNYLTPFALTQANIIPVVAPEQSSDIIPEMGKPFIFTLVCFAKQPSTLNSYDPIDVTLAVPGPVTDEEVDSQISMFLNVYQEQNCANESKIDRSQLTDEWVDAHLGEQGIKNVEMLRDAMAQAAEHYQAEQVMVKEQQTAMGAWASRLVEVPSQELVDAFAEDMIYSAIMEMGQNGMTLEQYLKLENKTEEEFKVAAKERAKAALYGSFAMDAIFEHEHMELTDEWIENTTRGIDPQGDVKEIIESYKREGRYFMLVENAQRAMAADWAMDHTNFSFEEE